MEFKGPLESLRLQLVDSSASDWQDHTKDLVSFPVFKLLAFKLRQILNIIIAVQQLVLLWCQKQS